MNKTNPRPVAFVLAATNHGTMLVNRHDWHMVGNVGYGVGCQLLARGCYDPEEVDVAGQLLQARREAFGDGVVAVDCGANVGVHTLEWAQFMHGWGEVIAIEAQERVFYALAGNITLNNCFNARALWAAVGAAAGTIDVPVPDYLSPGNFASIELRQRANREPIGQDYAARAATATPMMALDDLGLARADLVKIDVEGMEMEALAGATDTLARCRPLLIVERLKTAEDDIRGFVEPLGYRTFAFGQNLLAVHAADPTLGKLSVA